MEGDTNLVQSTNNVQNTGGVTVASTPVSATVSTPPIVPAPPVAMPVAPVVSEVNTPPVVVQAQPVVTNVPVQPTQNIPSTPTAPATVVSPNIPVAVPPVQTVSPVVPSPVTNIPVNSTPLSPIQNNPTIAVPTIPAQKNVPIAVPVVPPVVSVQSVPVASPISIESKPAITITSTPPQNPPVTVTTTVPIQNVPVSAPPVPKQPVVLAETDTISPVQIVNTPAQNPPVTATIPIQDVPVSAPPIPKHPVVLAGTDTISTVQVVESSPVVKTLSTSEKSSVYASAVSTTTTTNDTLESLRERFMKYGLSETDAMNRAKHILGVIPKQDPSLLSEIDEYIVKQLVDKALAAGYIAGTNALLVKVYLQKKLIPHISKTAEEKTVILLETLKEYMKNPSVAQPTPEGGLPQSPIEREAQKERARSKRRQIQTQVKTFSNIGESTTLGTEQAQNTDTSSVSNDDGALEDNNSDLSPFEDYVTSKPDDKSDTVAIKLQQNVHEQLDNNNNDNGQVSQAIHLYDDNSIFSNSDTKGVDFTPEVPKKDGVNITDGNDNKVETQNDVTNGVVIKNTALTPSNDGGISAEPEKKTQELNDESRVASLFKSWFGGKTQSEVNTSMLAGGSGDEKMSAGQSLLTSASNTEVGAVDPQSSSELKNAEATTVTQSKEKDFFNTYITQRIDAVMEELKKNKDIHIDMIGGIKESLFKESTEIIGRGQVSISDRIALLDQLVEKYRDEYIAGGPIKQFTVDDIINRIMKKAEKEVHTGNTDDDWRFRDTLRNAITSKIKQMTSDGTPQETIQESIDKEYEMIKSFYISRVSPD